MQQNYCVVLEIKLLQILPNCPSPICTLTNNFVFLVKCFAEFWDFANTIIEKMGSQIILMFISLIWNEVEHLLGNSLAILWLGLHASHTHTFTHACVCVHTHVHVYAWVSD